ncbi:S8 family serine peptidase [Bradyrhizobium sp. BR13661]|uniref:S8 family serine peptidase n=2 Tax=Pseudomonadota TaxID=1224 RepID=UPI002473152A|nr:S8 family serine peptidase [Bradyrhizobium sp. BR13661]
MRDAAVCLPNRLGADLSHGTAVALLVRTVAPEAALDLYAIGSADGPDRHAIGAALRKVAASEATVLCMSLGVPVSLANVELNMLDPSLLAVAARPRQCPIPSGCLCEAITALGDRAVFAAVGNDAGSLFCPAMSQAVYAIGFQLERRIADPERGESAWATEPSGYGQSAAVVDYTLMQPEGVLGSSFATPLVAGAAALQNDPAAIESMQQACHLGAVADNLLADYRSKVADPVELAQALELYNKALLTFPHQADLQAGAHWCIGCALYGGTLFVNAGLAHLEAKDFASAERLLRIARQITPRSADAAANLATCLMLRAETIPDEAGASLLREAVAAFDQAIALRPNYRGYDQARAHAATMLASRNAR